MTYLTEREWAEEFSKKLNSLMLVHGYTQHRLASETGISQSAISRYLSGEQFPTVKSIVALSYVFLCRTDELIDFGAPIV